MHDIITRRVSEGSIAYSSGGDAVASRKREASNSGIQLSVSGLKWLWVANADRYPYHFDTIASIDSLSLPADVAELADALASGASGGNPVEVQVLSWAPSHSSLGWLDGV